VGSNPTQGMDVWCVYAFIPFPCCRLPASTLIFFVSPYNNAGRNRNSSKTDWLRTERPELRVPARTGIFSCRHCIHISTWTQPGSYQMSPTGPLTIFYCLTSLGDFEFHEMFCGLCLFVYTVFDHVLPYI
jgi:hypothetical protein